MAAQIWETESPAKLSDRLLRLREDEDQLHTAVWRIFGLCGGTRRC
jgi:hypothetical protein